MGEILDPSQKAAVMEAVQDILKDGRRKQESVAAKATEYNRLDSALSLLMLDERYYIQGAPSRVELNNNASVALIRLRAMAEADLVKNMFANYQRGMSRPFNLMVRHKSKL